MSLLMKALIPFMRVLSSPPNHLSKVPPPNTITLGISASVYGCWGDIIRLMEVEELGSKAGTVVTRVDWDRW